jgi:hypothetical protein
MPTVRAAIFALINVFASSCFGASSFVIEPDDYAHGTNLNDINPRVQLRIYTGNDFPTSYGVFPDPAIIPVSALTNEDILGGYFTSTGTKSFGHYLIGFNPQSRQIGMKFNGAASSVSIDVIGRSDFRGAIGVLEVFSPTGMLLESVSSAPLGRHDVATLSITRPATDIGYARAYSSLTGSPFGTFDNLRFSSVPEPAGASLAAFGLLALIYRHVRSRPGR